MKALVLSAGEGTRLKQLTQSRPKPMLPIRGRPLLEHILEWLLYHGVSDIAVNLHYRPQTIMQHFGDGNDFGVAITYSYESALMGTAGAAKQLEHYLDERFVVAYGDVLTNVDLARLIAFHDSQLAQHPKKPSVTLALYRVPDPTQTGLVELSQTGRITRFLEKPAPDQVFTELAFSGIMVCEPSVLDWIPADTVFDFGHDLFPTLLAAGIPLMGIEISPSEYIVDIGTLPGYLRALHLSDGNRGVA